MTDVWRKIENQQEAILFWKAGSNALLNMKETVCPTCQKHPVRYYAHHFSQERSAMWVWCSNCKMWSIASNMKLEASFGDPLEGLDLKEFEELERSNWLDRINQLWEEGLLPQKLD